MQGTCSKFAIYRPVQSWRHHIIIARRVHMVCLKFLTSCSTSVNKLLQLCKQLVTWRNWACCILLKQFATSLHVDICNQHVHNIKKLSDWSTNSKSAYENLHKSILDKLLSLIMTICDRSFLNKLKQFLQMHLISTWLNKMNQDYSRFLTIYFSHLWSFPHLPLRTIRSFFIFANFVQMSKLDVCLLLLIFSPHMKWLKASNLKYQFVLCVKSLAIFTS